MQSNIKFIKTTDTSEKILNYFFIEKLSNSLMSLMVTLPGEDLAFIVSISNQFAEKVTEMELNEYLNI